MYIERKRANGVDGMIRKGPFSGHARYYRDALFSTLVHFKPKVCLEIGTYTGESSAVFQDYFNQYCPDGLLITCDIHAYSKLDMPNVKRVLVYPHSMDNVGRHNVTPLSMRPDYNDQTKMSESVERNIGIILHEFIGDGLPLETTHVFDFCFLDGDHSTHSLVNDLDIAWGVLKNNAPILLDDTDEWEHECAEYYHKHIKVKDDLNTYEFQDWPVKVGAALIWERKHGESTTKIQYDSLMKLKLDN